MSRRPSWQGKQTIWYWWHCHFCHGQNYISSFLRRVRLCVSKLAYQCHCKLEKPAIEWVCVWPTWVRAANQNNGSQACTDITYAITELLPKKRIPQTRAPTVHDCKIVARCSSANNKQHAWVEFNWSWAIDESFGFMFETKPKSGPPLNDSSVCVRAVSLVIAPNLLSWKIWLEQSENAENAMESRDKHEPFRLFLTQCNRIFWAETETSWLFMSIQEERLNFSVCISRWSIM